MEFGLVLKSMGIKVSQSKLVFCLSAFPLLVLLRLHSETLVAKFCCSLSGFFEGSASVFLLMNCLIASIFASSRMESKSATSKGQLESHDHELPHSNQNKEQCTPTEEDGFNDWTAKKNVSMNEEEISINDVNQEEGNALIRGVSDVNEEEGNALIRGVNDVNQEEGNALIKGVNGVNGGTDVGIKEIHDSHCQKQLQVVISQTGEKTQGAEDQHSASESVKHGDNHATNDEDAAPSAEQVWAAILSSKKSSNQLLRSATDNHINSAMNAGPPAAAPISAVPARPVIAAGQGEPAAAGATHAVAATRADHLASATAKTPAVNDEEDERWQVEELNRRAEEFIARFNHQMRLQRLESLQRSRGQRRTRRCHHHHQRHHHQILPAAAAAPAGLLVG